ncbi:hypothetical protein HZS_6343, partial [Henneguya salminicola]
MFNKFKKSNQIKVFKKKDPCLDFTLGSQIGSGSFGNVYLANDLNGNIVVIKVCEATCDEEKKYFEREAEILKMCEHPNILTAIDFYYWDKKSWMILELCIGGSLDTIVSNLKTLDEPTIKALAYLHDLGIIHRDIKAGNIFLTEKGLYYCRQNFPQMYLLELFIALHTETNSAAYYDFKADVYSLGITLIELAESNPPDGHLGPAQIIICRIRNESPTFMNPSRWSKDLNQFVELTLTKNPQHRPTAAQCLQLPFLKGDDINDTKLLVELCNVSRAILLGECIQEDVTMAEEEENQSEDSSAFESDISMPPESKSMLSSLAPSKSAARTVKKTIRYEINGVKKERIVFDVVDVDGKDKLEHEKIMREKMMNNLKQVKLEEQRELRKLENSHKIQMADLSARHQTDYDALTDKYWAESELQNKNINKEIERKKIILKTELEKVFKKSKNVVEKERKTQILAMKSKNKEKQDPRYYDENYLRNIQDKCSNSLANLKTAYDAELVEFGLKLVQQKLSVMEEMLKNLVTVRLTQIIEVSQMAKNQCCAKFELVLQRLVKCNQKELSITEKILAEKVEQKKIQLAKITRDFPKKMRSEMKKQLDAYYKQIKREKSGREKELFLAKKEELVEKFNIELKTMNDQHDAEIKKMLDSNKKEICDVVDYQDQKSRFTHKSFQERLYQQYLQDEETSKNELIKMYNLKKSLEQTNESEISVAEKLR